MYVRVPGHLPAALCTRRTVCVCVRVILVARATRPASRKKKREGRRRTENGVCSSGQTSVWKGTAGRPDPGSSRLPPGLTSSSHEAFTPVESRCTCCGARVKTTAAQSIPTRHPRRRRRANAVPTPPPTHRLQAEPWACRYVLCRRSSAQNLPRPSATKQESVKVLQRTFRLPLVSSIEAVCRHCENNLSDVRSCNDFPKVIPFVAFCV